MKMDLLSSDAIEEYVGKCEVVVSKMSQKMIRKDNFVLALQEAECWTVQNRSLLELQVAISIDESFLAQQPSKRGIGMMPQSLTASVDDDRRTWLAGRIATWCLRFMDDKWKYGGARLPLLWDDKLKYAKV